MVASFSFLKSCLEYQHLTALVVIMTSSMRSTSVTLGLSLQLGKTGGYLGDYIAFFLIWQLVASSCGNQRLSVQHLQSLGVSF